MENKGEAEEEEAGSCWSPFLRCSDVVRPFNRGLKVILPSLSFMSYGILYQKNIKISAAIVAVLFCCFLSLKFLVVDPMG